MTTRPPRVPTASFERSTTMSIPLKNRSDNNIRYIDVINIDRPNHAYLHSRITDNKNLAHSKPTAGYIPSQHWLSQLACRHLIGGQTLFIQ